MKSHPLEEEREALENIHERFGIIEPERVVKEAKKKSSPLHKHFTWDNDEAANKFRIHQARLLIRTVTITVTIQHEEQPVRAFHSLASETGETGYKPLAVILSNEESRDMLVQRAYREFKSFRLKYKHLEEFAKVFAAADEEAA